MCNVINTIKTTYELLSYFIKLFCEFSCELMSCDVFCCLKRTYQEQLISSIAISPSPLHMF